MSRNRETAKWTGWDEVEEGRPYMNNTVTPKRNYPRVTGVARGVIHTNTGAVGDLLPVLCEVPCEGGNVAWETLAFACDHITTNHTTYYATHSIFYYLSLLRARGNLTTALLIPSLNVVRSRALQ